MKVKLNFDVFKLFVCNKMCSDINQSTQITWSSMLQS